MWPLTQQERRALFLAAIVLTISLFIKILFSLFPSWAQSCRVLDDVRYQPKVDINRAGYTELLTIRGIGPSSAAKIINYRQKHARVRSPLELAYLLKKKPRAIRHLEGEFKWP